MIPVNFDQLRAVLADVIPPQHHRTPLVNLQHYWQPDLSDMPDPDDA